MKEKAVGIVVEYNPFHYGHLYQIQKIQKDFPGATIVVIMSPHFTQRGLPTIVSKKERTIAALRHGVDLVLELPTKFVLQRADIFAYAGVQLLSKLNIDTLVFGSENPDFMRYPKSDWTLLEDGTSFAKAGNQNQLHPNEILGAFYQKHAQKLNIQLRPIKRIQNDYHSLDLQGTISSATAIRKAYWNQKDYTLATPMILEAMDTFDIEAFMPFIKAKIIQTPKSEMKKYMLMDEGIENLFKKLAEDPQKDLIKDAVSKRYTQSRIQRTLMNFYLGILKHDNQLPSHARVLGATRKGLNYLGNIKGSGQYVSRFQDYPLHQEELRFTMLYGIVKDKKTQEKLIQEELSFPIILK